MSQFIDLPASADRLTRGILIRRVCALLVDCLAIGLASSACALGIAIFGIFTLGLGWFAFHILPFVPLVYFILLVGLRGATFGQTAMGLALRQDVNLAPPTMAQALVWTILLWLSFMFCFIPFALALLGPRHRAAHDLLSGLVVIRSP